MTAREALSHANGTRTCVQILVVDDFEPWCRFIRTLLEARPELRIVGEAHDGYTAIEKAKELQPDLILLDIGLPGLNGIEVSCQVRQMVPNSKIIFVTESNAKTVIDAALSTGAVGYVIKHNAVSELLSAIDAALEKKSFVR